MARASRPRLPAPSRYAARPEAGSIDAQDLARAFDLPTSRVLSFLRRVGVRSRRHFEQRLLTDPDARHLRQELRRWLRVPWSVRCRECGRRFKALTSFHLRRHGLTCAEYREAHPTPFLRSFDLFERSRERQGGRGAFHWSAEQVDLLRQHHGKCRLQDLCVLLGASAKVVRLKAKRLNLHVPSRPRWRARQDSIARRLIGEVSEEEIARRIGRSRESVRQHVLTARIRPPLIEFRPWTRRDDALLRREFGRIPTRDLADKMGRSTQALQSRSHRFGGLKLGRKPPLWSRADLDALARWAGVIPTPEIAQRLGRSVISVNAQARKRRISLRHELLWTRRDEARLPKLVERLGVDRAARHMGRTPRAIRNRLAKLKLRETRALGT